MIERTYMVNFDAGSVNLPAFHRYLTDSREVVRFWNYIPLSYFIRTSLDATDLSQRIAPFIPVGNFIVAEINAANLNGRLPPVAWSWFYNPPPPPPTQLPGLFAPDPPQQK